ncbi:hypothetical protein EVAR_51790_1, partial [Eumeta japonica]
MSRDRGDNGRGGLAEPGVDLAARRLRECGVLSERPVLAEAASQTRAQPLTLREHTIHTFGSRERAAYASRQLPATRTAHAF